MNASTRPLSEDELRRLTALAPSEREALLVLRARDLFEGTIVGATPPEHPAPPRPGPLSTAPAPPAAEASPPPPIYIPRRTREKLVNPAGEGERHQQAKEIAYSLAGQGLNADAIFAQVRPSYDPLGFPDDELTGIIRWAVGKQPKPCHPGGVQVRSPKRTALPQPPERKVTAEEAQANVESFLGPFRCAPADLYNASPCRPLEDWRVDAMPFLLALYQPEELVNVVTEFTLDPKGKANPRGGGQTRTRDEWLDLIRKTGVPQDKAGAWFRVNPVAAHRGSGGAGSYLDGDIAAFRFVLLESDKLPLDLQLSLFARLHLPIAAIYDTAGRGPHALVRVDCAGAEEYRATVARLYELLARYGIDPANKNPSRLSRLPGARRFIGAIDPVAGGEQRLLYLDPSPPVGRSIFQEKGAAKS